MKKFSLDQYTNLRKDTHVLSKDKFGEKVLRLKDGFILKLFRTKRLISSARFMPYARRFSKNADTLSTLNIPTVEVSDTFKIPGMKRNAVLYKPLEGVTLRDYLIKNSMSSLISNITISLTRSPRLVRQQPTLACGCSMCMRSGARR